MSGDAAELLDQARAAVQGGRRLDAHLLVAAAVTALAAPAGIRPVVVGGTAVDFYAAETIGDTLRPSDRIRPTLDVDMVAFETPRDAAALRRILADTPGIRSASPGLPVRATRTWLAEDLPIAIEVVGDELAGDPDRVVTLDVESGTVYLWGPEDTFWQYAENAWSMRDRNDWLRALCIAAAQELDWRYLEKSARSWDLGAILAAAREQAPYDQMIERLRSGR